MGIIEGFDTIWLGHNNLYCNTSIFCFLFSGNSQPNHGTNVRKVMVLAMMMTCMIEPSQWYEAQARVVMENMYNYYCIIYRFEVCWIRPHAYFSLSPYWRMNQEVRYYGTQKVLLSTNHSKLWLNHLWFKRWHSSPSAFSPFIDSSTGDSVILWLAEGMNFCVPWYILLH